MQVRDYGIDIVIYFQLIKVETSSLNNFKVLKGFFPIVKIKPTLLSIFINMSWEKEFHIKQIKMTKVTKIVWTFVNVHLHSLYKYVIHLSKVSQNNSKGHQILPNLIKQSKNKRKWIIFSNYPWYQTNLTNFTTSILLIKNKICGKY